MDEMNKVNEYVQAQAGNNADLIYGVGVDPALEDAFKCNGNCYRFQIELNS
jgi:cell division protein FtsZ